MKSDLSGVSGSVTIRSGRDAQRARTLLVTATLVTMALWYIPGVEALLYPLRLFVTFVHESGHALATLLVGGQVVSLQISSTGSGAVQSQVSPLWAWLVFSSGYLSTALFGATLLHVGRMRRWRDAGRAALVGAALTVLGMTLMFGRDPFTWMAGLVIFSLLMGMAWLLPSGAADFMASFLAVQCSLNALGDINILLNLTASGHPHNDAAFMAQAYPLLPPMGWAILWAFMAAVILGISLRNYWRATAVRI